LEPGESNRWHITAWRIWGQPLSNQLPGDYRKFSLFVRRRPGFRLRKSENCGGTILNFFETLQMFVLVVAKGEKKPAIS
jgi:hypothetical protein